MSTDTAVAGGKGRLDLLHSLPFISVHLACLLVIWAGISWTAVAACAILYYARAFGLTAGYHRYFAHKTYKTGRVFRFLLAALGASAAQMGPLWWAGHHRIHHRYVDTEADVHSPSRQGFWWAHVGWIVSDRYLHTNEAVIKDFARFPELRWLDRFHWVPPVLLAAGLFGLGAGLDAARPELGTSGLQLLTWGFFISTVLLYHGTFFVNSLAHTWGTRRFDTRDTSRNNLLITLLTLGEGWHNNHHRYPASERQGFYFWEIDPTHYLLKLLSWAGLVRELAVPPPAVYAEAAARR
jgi:stearoyl-CoA desaturase (delta-9 desaturase)